MKNPSGLVLALMLSLLGSACRRQEVPAPPEPAAGSLPPAAPTAERPANLPGPEDLPPCPALLSVDQSSGDSRNGSARLRCASAPDSLQDFYASQLLADGWILASSIRQGKEHHLQFQQGARFIRIQIGPAPDRGTGSQVRLAWGLPAEATEVLDSQAPDFEEELSDADPPSHEW